MIPGQVKALKWVVESTRAITYGIVQAGEDVEGGVPYIRPVDMSDEQGIKTETLRTTSKEIANSYKRSEVKANDLVVSIGPSYGKVMVVPADLEGANLTQGTARVAVDGFKARSRYVFWALRSSYVASQWSSQINATTFGGLNLEPLANTKVFLPDIATQEKLASFLDRETARIDALVAKKTRFIDLLREKRQALITHAVTKGLDPKVKMKDSGVEWLGEVPEHWAVVRFRDLCTSISTGPFGTALGNGDYVTGGVPVINPSHIVDEQCCPDYEISVSLKAAERLSFWAMQPGDLVTARRGELGRAAIITEEQRGWICGTGSLRVRPDTGRVTVEYLHTVLQSRYAREWLNLSSVGATMANLNEGILGQLPVAFPPSSAEQNELLNALKMHVHRLSLIEERAAASITLLKERRSALITAAVTGQIDLRAAV